MKRTATLILGAWLLSALAFAQTPALIAEHIATMSRWSLAEDEATVSFDAYAVGPYAEGSYGCTFAMDALKRLAKPGAPLP